ncbi:N-formylglutamate amidohydrolase [Sphingosinicellaceae bacterium]|nr:N-formylglutamate amidohydrolase [Sphingosinicellaceae bacterium]
MLLVADHASDHVPAGIELGVAPAVMRSHVAVDLGVDALTRRLATLLGASALLGHVSRLVIDLNREPESPGLIPASSDGVVVPGNTDLPDHERGRRIAVYHRPYHDGLAARLDADPPRLIVSVHSFTPALASRDEARPWPIGILYNRDERAARIAIERLCGQGIDAGDNEPYSGRHLNYTMDRHAEARGLPYLGIEVRQDGLADEAGVERWAVVLADIIRACV